MGGCSNHQREEILPMLAVIIIVLLGGVVLLGGGNTLTGFGNDLKTSGDRIHNVAK
jgi:predicted small secreted protein